MAAHGGTTGFKTRVYGLRLDGRDGLTNKGIIQRIRQADARPAEHDQRRVECHALCSEEQLQVLSVVSRQAAPQLHHISIVQSKPLPTALRCDGRLAKRRLLDHNRNVNLGRCSILLISFFFRPCTGGEGGGDRTRGDHEQMIDC